MHHPHLVDARRGPGQVERLRHVGRLHRRPKHPGDDVARVIVQHGRQVVPAAPDHLQVGKVRLPEFVRPMGRMVERLPGRQHDEGRTRNQVIRSENAIDARFREKVTLSIRELPRQLPRRPLGISQRRFDDPLPHPRGNLVPVPAGHRRGGLETGSPALEVAVIPRVERGPIDPQFSQRLAHGQLRPLDQPDERVFLGRGAPHVPLSEAEAVTPFLAAESEAPTRLPRA